MIAKKAKARASASAKKPAAKKRAAAKPKPAAPKPLIKGKHPPCAVALGRARAVVADGTGKVVVLDRATGEQLHSIVGGESLLSLALVDDDIAVVGTMRSFALFRLADARRALPKEPFPPRASALARVPGTRRVVAGGHTDLVLWSVDTASIVASVEAPTSAVAVSSEGVAAALGETEDGEIVLRTWNVRIARPGGPVVFRDPSFPKRSAIIIVGRRVTFPFEGGLAIYDVARSQWLRAPPPGAVFRLLAASLPNGDVLVTDPFAPNLLRLEATTGHVLAEHPLPIKKPRTALAVDPDGTTALVGFGDGSSHLVPVPTLVRSES